MSYIRWDDRRWTEGKSFYALCLVGNPPVIARQGSWYVPNDEWVEVVMRMIERGDFSDEELGRIHETLIEEAHLEIEGSE